LKETNDGGKESNEMRKKEAKVEENSVQIMKGKRKNKMNMQKDAGRC
jgi:hypothetical protein